MDTKTEVRTVLAMVVFGMVVCAFCSPELENRNPKARTVTCFLCPQG
jgi:hypothetical protein